MRQVLDRGIFWSVGSNFVLGESKMAILGVKHNSEEVLVVRVDGKGNILKVIYHRDKNPRLAKKIHGKNFKNIGLKEKNYKQCEVYLRKVFVNLQQVYFTLSTSKKYYQISYLPEWNDKEQVESVLAIVRDITKDKKIIDELKTTNELFAARLSTTKRVGKITKMGYFEWDQDNDTIYWSDQQYRNLGYKPGEVRPSIELFRSLIYPGDFKEMEAAIAEFYKKSYLEFEFRVIRGNGSLTWLYARIHIIADAKNQGSKIFGVTQDITDQKKADERIQRAERELAFTNQLYSRSTYLNKLLFNSYPTEYIIKELNQFGIDTQMTYCCFILQLTDKWSDNDGDKMTPSIVRKQAVLTWLAEKEWGVVWRCHDNIVMLSAVVENNIVSKFCQIRFADNIIAEIEKVFLRYYVKIGISGISGIPVNFRENYEKAQRAVSIPATMDCSSTTHYDDIRLYEVAFQLSQDKNTCLMVETTIGRLAEYDKGRGSDLLLTLECILEHTSLKVVAQKLFIHYNTVLWRKRRIEIFLEMSLDNMETKMLLLLYVKMWNLKKYIL